MLKQQIQYQQEKFLYKMQYIFGNFNVKDVVCMCV